MAAIYEEKTENLHALLDRARSSEGATVLIPDLQRAYVWSPNQVTLLVDSLVRGWPFGTLLMWKVGKEEIGNIPHRQFWTEVNRCAGEKGQSVPRCNPPASYHMVLDGQQRVQSLLLALGGDSWGFKMEDRAWAQEVQDRRPRGRQGKYRHWSKGCLCFDLDRFLEGYSAGGDVLSVDFRNVLKWMVTDPTEGQSKWAKPKNYEEPLAKAFSPENKGSFIRLHRLWKAATPDSNIKESKFREIVKELFASEAIPDDKAEKLLLPMGELMTTLRDVKLSKVTYLELQPYNPAVWTEDEYNDAIVNIFTRLNTAGRTLTREEITLAWLKNGWDDTKTGGKSAGECFETLLTELADQKLWVQLDDLVRLVSVVWAIKHNDGKLLEDRDLLKGPIIRPMAVTLSENWSRITDAAKEGVTIAKERELQYGSGSQYASLNAMAIVWAWSYLAISWKEEHGLRELPRDDFEKTCKAILEEHLDRWLLGSQWAGRWTDNRAVANYAKDLNTDAIKLQGIGDMKQACAVLKDRMAALVKDIEADASRQIDVISTSTRERVSIYRNVLWIWHRLDEKRWNMSRIQLRTGKSTQTSLDVDHTVAYALWERMLQAGLPEGAEEVEDALPIVNRLGNCSLLEKSFNISKSDKTLKSFIEQAHELKANKVELADWAEALGIPATMLDPSGVDATTIAKAIDDRDKLIRKEVNEFVAGKRTRADKAGV